jgi:hypothetical protein
MSTDVFLYPGEPNPNDIRLGDPTVLRSGAAVFTYAGVIACASGVAAQVSKTKEPPTSIVAGSSVAAGISRARVPGVIYAGQASIAAAVSKTKAPPTVIDCHAEISAACSFTAAPIAEPFSLPDRSWFVPTRRPQPRTFVARTGIRIRRPLVAAQVSKTRAPSTDIRFSVGVYNADRFDWLIRKEDEALLDLLGLEEVV